MSPHMRAYVVTYAGVICDDDVDAAAALGILERQGVGRVRHLDIGVLWLQEQLLRRVVELTKVLGTRVIRPTS